MLDSHVHLWDLGVRDQAWIPPGSPLRRSFDAGDLRVGWADLGSPGFPGLQAIASAGWTYAELAPYVDVALEAFGPGRLIFGSDWPVCTPAASYSRVCQVAQLACSGPSDPDRTNVLAGNARAIYRTG